MTLRAGADIWCEVIEDGHKFKIIQKLWMTRANIAKMLKDGRSVLQGWSGKNRRHSESGETRGKDTIAGMKQVRLSQCYRI